MKKIVVLLCALFFPVVTLALETDRAEIVYAPAEVSVQSVQAQFDAAAGRISQQLKNAPKGSSITIQIVGGADQTGTSPENDKIAASRADRAAAALAKRFPMATITPFSLSDDANERTVNLQWKIVPPPPLPMIPKAPAWDSWKILTLMLVLGMLAVVFIVGAMLYIIAVVKKEGKRKTALVAKITVKDARNKRTLCVPIVYDGSVYRLPLHYQDGNPMVRPTLRDAKSACQLASKPNWQEETERLILAREIEVLKD